MKKILLSAAVFALSATAFAQTKIAEVAKFATETIDFGKIKQGVPQKGTFTVTNIGKTPLIIEQANPTCGCTISDYTKEPIAPGKTGVINATYNAAAMGHFEKHLTVKFAGVDEMKSITFTGDVIAAEQYDKDKMQAAGNTAATTDNVKEKEAAANEIKAKETATKPATLKKAPVKATKKVVKNS
ncbi:MAG: DUF1573 domain-containing protein [Chitinophagaceae bacterium]|nr:DUF1573 domain-containing protein [Chitinophagaceae bacterium]